MRRARAASASLVAALALAIPAGAADLAWRATGSLLDIVPVAEDGESLLRLNCTNQVFSLEFANLPIDSTKIKAALDDKRPMRFTVVAVIGGKRTKVCSAIGAFSRSASGDADSPSRLPGEGDV